MAKYIKEYARKAGLQVENAKHDLVVSVTRSDVEKGKAKDSECCAIARALMKQNNGAARVFIFKATAYVETARRLIRYSLPQSVQKEVVSFDRFQTMEPGVYQLKAPPPSRDPAAEKARHQRKKRAAKREPVPKAQGFARPKIRHVTKGVRTGLRETSGL